MDDHIECSECGHPLERHSTRGCDWQTDGCDCRASWTVHQVQEMRRDAGLTVKFKSWNY
jgi:hypothetical protein